MMGDLGGTMDGGEEEEGGGEAEGGRTKGRRGGNSVFDAA